jgi:deazaflavin-dependent oxidoreductase (nitroreductase family)
MSILDKVPWIQQHIDLYRSDPAKAHNWKGPGWDVALPTLLLTTKGRKTGQPRDIPLIYGKSGNRFVVVASLGGAPDHPMWYKNLAADRDAEIQVDVDHFKVKARDAQGAERAELWNLMADIFPTYNDYARMTAGKREIPVVVLEPR